MLGRLRFTDVAPPSLIAPNSRQQPRRLSSLLPPPFLPSLIYASPTPCLDASPPAEARVAKWQEQWEATQSNLKKYDVHPKEQLPSGHTLPWRTWRTANRVRSGQAATPVAKHLWGYRESETCVCGAAGHFMTSCRHFGGETKQRRNCRNGGSSSMMDERRWRHDINEPTFSSTPQALPDPTPCPHTGLCRCLPVYRLLQYRLSR